MAPGPLQILIVVMLILVVFGASRLPFIAENLAKGIKSFKTGLKDESDDSGEPKSLDKKSDKNS